MRVYPEQRKPETAATELVEEEAAGSRVSSSIEIMEPKTLTFNQIKYAREAALYVVSTKTEEEAIRIFTAGLKPVQMMTAAAPKLSSVDSSDDDVDLDGCIIATGRRGRRQRPSSSSTDMIRDVATAPF